MTLIVRGHGHTMVRASHGKTLELTPADELGIGGTCVVAVGAATTGKPLAGALDGELTVAGHTLHFSALGNPEWSPTGPAVIRRSDVRKPDTIATHSTLSAADLPRELIDALRDPAHEVTLTLRHTRPQPRRLVIAPTGEASAAEREAADANRVLLLQPADELTLRTAAQPIEVIGVDAATAVVLASPNAVGRDSARALTDDVRDRPVVLRLAATDIDKTMRAAHRRGRRTGAILGRLPWVYSGDLDSLPIPTGIRSVWLCLDPAPSVDLDQRIAELRADGLPVKQIAKQLSVELGLPAKQVYARATSSA